MPACNIVDSGQWLENTNAKDKKPSRRDEMSITPGVSRGAPATTIRKPRRGVTGLCHNHNEGPPPIDITMRKESIKILTNHDQKKGSFTNLMKGADTFPAAPVPGTVSCDMIKAW